MPDMTDEHPCLGALDGFFTIFRQTVDFNAQPLSLLPPKWQHDQLQRPETEIMACLHCMAAMRLLAPQPNHVNLLQAGSSDLMPDMA